MVARLEDNHRLGEDDGDAYRRCFWHFRHLRDARALSATAACAGMLVMRRRLAVVLMHGVRRGSMVRGTGGSRRQRVRRHRSQAVHRARRAACAACSHRQNDDEAKQDAEKREDGSAQGGHDFIIRRPNAKSNRPDISTGATRLDRSGGSSACRACENGRTPVRFRWRS
jgi:hypothetical protein